MNNPSEKIKYMTNRGLWGLVLLLSAVALVGYAWDLSRASFYRKTQLGQNILRYLSCIDFDCFELQSQIVKSGHDAVPPLLDLLKRGLPKELAGQAPGDIRPKVISLLGAIGDSRAVPFLVTILKDESPILRAAAVGALGAIGGNLQLEPILPLLGDRDELVRETTAIALRRLGQKEGLPALKKAALVESKAHVRKEIDETIRALEKR